MTDPTTRDPAAELAHALYSVEVRGQGRSAVVGYDPGRAHLCVDWCAIHAPALLAEVERLRAKLAAEDAAYTKACGRIDYETERANTAEQVAREESARLDYIERTFSGMTNRERYLPVTMIWGKGCNGRTLREACDKYMKRDADSHHGARTGESNDG